ncbi:MAG: retropepsin-like aspartic protease [Ignavibacteriales bacterium]
MKFKYLKQPSLLDPQKPWISRPFIPVRLVYKDKYIDVYGLVDSGADASLFHSSVAKELGIDLESGKRKQFFGITEQGIDVYFHKIRLQIRGFSDSIELEVGFTNSKGVGAILGQAGFFENYHIKFERDKEQVEITPIRKSRK